MGNERSATPVIVMREGFGAGALFLAFLGGAMAGAAAALLTAPQSGAQSRARLREIASRPKVLMNRVPDAVVDAADAFTDALKDPKVPHASRK